MSITTYAELKTAVGNWLHDSSLTSRIPEFIVFAESAISNDPNPLDPGVLPGVRCQDMVTTTSLTLDSETEPTPTGFLGVVDFKVTTTPEHKLKFITTPIFHSKYPVPAEGDPKVYTIIGDNFYLRNVPTSTSSYAADLHYYKRYTAFSADGDYNWLLTNHPFIYLYGALVASMPFLRETEGTNWEAEYRKSVNALNATEASKNRGQSPSVRTHRPTP